MAGGVGDAGLDVVVVTLVLVLLLAPHQVGIDVLVDFSLHQIKGERKELQRESRSLSNRNTTIDQRQLMDSRFEL